MGENEEDSVTRRVDSPRGDIARKCEVVCYSSIMHHLARLTPQRKAVGSQMADKGVEERENRPRSFDRYAEKDVSVD